jgi:3-hydroxyisobutyrate dehydrogenase
MNTVQIDGIAYDLPALEKDCWIRLLNGTLTYKNPFHNPVVANTNAHGVNLRTVVLRKVDTQKKALFFHTDTRSGKWSDLEKDNKVSWLFYNPTSRVQLRLGGNAVLHQSDAIADEAWAKSNMSSRKIYLGVEGPSSVAEMPVSGLPASFEVADPTLEESEAGRKNFGLVSTHVHWMEWLWLNSKGHRRAEFKYDSELNFSANWLVP